MRNKRFVLILGSLLALVVCSWTTSNTAFADAQNG